MRTKIFTFGIALLLIPISGWSEELESILLRGSALGKQKSYKAAANCFREGLKSYPGEEKLLFFLGLSDLRLGKIDEAQKCQQALSQQGSPLAKKLEAEIPTAGSNSIIPLSTNPHDTAALEKACQVTRKILAGATTMYFMDHPGAPVPSDLQQSFRESGLIREHLKCPSGSELSIAFEDTVCKIQCPNHVMLTEELGQRDRPGTLVETPTSARNVALPYLNSYREGKSVGYKSREEGIIIPPQFDWAGYFSDNSVIAPVKKNGKFGFIDRSGHLVFPCEFESAGNIDTDGISSFKKNGLFGFMDTRSGAILIQPQFEQVNTFLRGHSVVKKGGKAGYINRKGEWLIPPQFLEAGHFPQDTAIPAIVKTEQGWNFIDRSGNLLFPDFYLDASEFANNLAPVLVHGKSSRNPLWGFIDLSGKWAIVPQFDSPYAPSIHGDIISADRKEFSLAEAKQKPMPETITCADGKTPPNSASSGNSRTDSRPVPSTPRKSGQGLPKILPDSEYTSVLKGHQLHLKDRRTGEIVLDGPETDALGGGVDHVQEGKRGYIRQGKVGFFDVQGNLLTPPIFDQAKPFSGGLAAVNDGHGWGFIDGTGKVVIKPHFQAVGNFSEGKAFFKSADATGFIDSSNKILFSCTADSARDFHEGRCMIIQNRKIGYIDDKGTVIVAPGYDDGGAFSSGVAPVKSRTLWGFIDQDGKMVIEPSFEGVTSVRSPGEEVGFSEGLCPVKKNGKWGFINPQGQLVIAAEFETTGNFKNGIAPVRKDRKTWYIDPAGNPVSTLVLPSLPPPSPPSR